MDKNEDKAPNAKANYFPIKTSDITMFATKSVTTSEPPNNI